MVEIEIIERLAKIEERSKSNTYQIGELKNVVADIHTMSNTMVQLVSEVQHTNDSVIQLKERVETMEREPSDRLRQVKSAIITAIASGIIGILVGAVASKI